MAVENTVNGTSTSTGLSEKVAVMEETVNSLNTQISALENQISRVETSVVAMSVMEGTIITMGNYKWMVCDLLDDGVVCIVVCGTKNNETVNSHGAWPGYIANGNSPSTTNWCYKDIHSMYGEDSELAKFYNEFHIAEASGGINTSTGLWSKTATKNGLYLVSAAKAAVGTSYNTALKNAASAYTNFGGQYNYGCWLGDPGPEGVTYARGTQRNSYYVHYTGGVYQDDHSLQHYTGYQLAPAFNLDLTKIKISGGVITLK